MQLDTTSKRIMRRVLATGLLLLVSPVFATVLVRFASPLRIELGPGDRDYVQGFDEWRWEDGASFRGFARRARLSMPVTLTGPGRFTVEARYPGRTTARLRVQFDEGAPLEMSLPSADEWRALSFELPPERVRAVARLRFETSGDGRLELRAAEWAGERALPSARLVRASAVLLAGTLAAFLLAGTSSRIAAGVCLLVGAAALAGSAFRPFAALHLVAASSPFVIAALVVALGVRLLRKGVSSWVMVLFLLALYFRAALLAHPAFHFYDLSIHETLVEVLYHRGVVDFWTRWPDYHVQYGLGLSLVEGERQPLLYPILFHALVHVPNSIYHAPVLWLELSLVLASALAVFPVAYLARRWSSVPDADVFAVGLYLLVPALTRSLFLVKFAATFGHLVDLCLVAYLASVSLRLDGRRRWLFGTLLVSLSLVAYNSGFINIGFLIGGCLVLTPIIGGLTIRQAVALATAGLVGLATALLCYHPVAVRNLFAYLTSGAAGEGEAAPYSSAAMALDFLGAPLLLVGLAGAFAMRRPESTPLRLLLYAWIASSLFALGLRFLVPEALIYHKEHYWVGAALAVTGGIGLAQMWRRSRLGALLVLTACAAAFGAWFLELHRMKGLFYGPYLF